MLRLQPRPLPKSHCCAAPLVPIYGSTVWAICMRCKKRCPVPDAWFCGKCEQENGRYPQHEIIPNHSLHCPKRHILRRGA